METPAYSDFFKALKPNILTLAPGWSSGYGMFTKGEAPLVISYTTSAAYHVEYENTDRYEALIFNDGHISQIEYAGLLKNAPNKENAKKFLDYLISDEAQKEIPLTQWMYPVNKNVSLPDSYKAAAPVPAKVLSIESVKSQKALESFLSVFGK
jgi:thiamine transport system substrate-binding protein